MTLSNKIKTWIKLPLVSCRTTVLAFAVVLLLGPWQGLVAVGQHKLPKNWKQFRIAMAGLEVTYPPDWTVSVIGPSDVWRLSFSSPGVWEEDISIFAAIRICSAPDAEALRAAECVERDSHLSDIAKDKMKSRKMLAVAGQPVERVEKEEFLKRRVYRYARFTAMGREFFIAGTFPRAYNMKRHIPIFDKMLMNLQVFQPKPATTFIDKKHSFRITFPDSWRMCSITPANKTNSSDEEELLRIVPKSLECSGLTAISISRLPATTGRDCGKTGYELMEYLATKGYSKVGPFLSGNMAARGWRPDFPYESEALFFTDTTTTCVLLKVSERVASVDADLKSEADEIMLTVWWLPSNFPQGR